MIIEYQPQTGKYYYYMNDQVNSNRMVTDENGDVVYSACYSPFGAVQVEWENTYDPKLKFSGKERNSYTGWDYFGARYYDHHSYRFTSVDPIINKEDSLVNPQLWNLYSYCGNNPITFFDPDGRLKRKKDRKLKVRPLGISIRTHEDAPGVGFKVKKGYLFSDDGTAILAYQNISGDKRFDTDCHGFTFTNSTFWIDNPYVSKILKGDNYRAVIKPKVGDIVIYYNESGNIVHSAIVSRVNDESIFVKGLGGLQSEAKETTLQKGWSNPNAKYKFFKKINKDEK